MSTVSRLAPGPFLASSTVSTQWLADHLGADNLAIVKAASRVRLLALRLDAAVSTVIVYDESDGLCAAEAARTLRDAGFERVAVLRGGRQRWSSEQRPVDLDDLTGRNGQSRFSPHEVEPRLA